MKCMHSAVCAYVGMIVLIYSYCSSISDRMKTKRKMNLCDLRQYGMMLATVVFLVLSCLLSHSLQYHRRSLHSVARAMCDVRCAMCYIYCYTGTLPHACPYPTPTPSHALSRPPTPSHALSHPLTFSHVLSCTCAGIHRTPTPLICHPLCTPTHPLNLTYPALPTYREKPIE